MMRISRTIEDIETDKSWEYSNENTVFEIANPEILFLTNSNDEEFTNITTVTYVKLPVLLSDFKLNFTVNGKFNLKEEFKLLKRVKRNIKLLKCKVIKSTNVIFIDGVIEEDMEYITKDKNLLKYKRNFTPFSCTSNIKYIKKPIFDEVKYSNESEFENIYKNEDTILFSITGQSINEEVYCELNKNVIREVVKINFNSIFNTLNVELYISLYQKQLVKL